MSSQHAQPPRSFRPEPGEYAAAQATLQAHGRQMGDYLRACLRWLASDPDTALATLAPAWPEPRPRGRPSPDTDATDSAGTTKTD